MYRCVPLEKLLNAATACLSASEHRAIRDHVNACPTCQARLTRIEETIHFMARYEPAVPVRIPRRLERRLLSMIPVSADQQRMREHSDAPALAKKIRRVVAQWIGPTGSQPLLARTQSATEAKAQDALARTRAHLYQAEDVEIVLALKPCGGDQWAIIGDVLLGEETGEKRRETGERRPPASLGREGSGEVTLRALDGSVQQVAATEGSAFVFDTVERGTYALQIPCGDRWIEIEALRVGWSKE